MNIYRSPDIAGSRSEGWLKQLAGATDNAMTAGSSGLSPENLSNFREANDLFTRAKEYDDPTSPFYHLVRSPDGLTTANTLAGLKPERVSQFNDAMSETGNDALNQQLQRQAIQRLISPTGGPADLKNLPGRFGRLQQEQLAGVLAPDQVSNLSDLARTSKIVHADTNTSGSGKVVQRVLEGSAALKGLGTAAAGLFHGDPAMIASGMGAAVVEPSLTAGLAKLSTSPKIVGGIMAPKPSLPTTGIALPSILAGSFARALGKPNEDKTQGGAGVSTPASPVAPALATPGESDADVVNRLGLTPEPSAVPKAAPAPESDEDVINRLGLTPP
jgi:hypothetical protein